MTKAIELRNGSGLEFIDISAEQYRRYIWSDGKEICIEFPQWLAVGNSGHRVLDGEGISHYVPYGWYHLTWKAKDGEPHFVK